MASQLKAVGKLLLLARWPPPVRYCHLATHVVDPIGRDPSSTFADVKHSQQSCEPHVELIAKDGERHQAFCQEEPRAV